MIASPTFRQPIMTTPSPRSHRAKRLGLAALILAAAVPVWALLGAKGKTPGAAPMRMADQGGVNLPTSAPQWKYVELAVAHAAPPLALLPSPGRISFDERRTSAVGTPLAGRIDRVAVRLGDRVEKGARLFSVRSGEMADLESARESARADVVVKQKVLERTRDLVRLQATAEKEQLIAEAQLKEAELAQHTAHSKLQSLKIAADGPNLFWVMAPRRGAVVDIDVYANQEVAPGRDKPLVQISDLEEVLVLADVAENDSADVQQGAEVEIRAQGGTVVRQGKVEHVSEVVDPQRRAVEVRIRVANGDRALRPNSLVEILFSPPAAALRVRVPSSAVVTDGEKSVVFVAKSPSRLERVPVTLGRQRDGEVELLAGLAPGTRYVSSGALLLLNEVELAD
ncbi:MAG TPA: efflux RND transporter periplasmic adaptor subunit [Polyangia bacterium]|jgi:RND family efflux transporter, MFP subunit|nr:efflux RND transporter periplasmic adaptor subunit [Polyangia bacterium]